MQFVTDLVVTVADQTTDIVVVLRIIHVKGYLLQM